MAANAEKQLMTYRIKQSDTENGDKAVSGWFKKLTSGGGKSAQYAGA